MARRKSKNARKPAQDDGRSAPPAPPAPTAAAWTLVALPAIASLCALLAVFQWMELLLADAGHASFCAVDDVFDCAAVWAAPLAKGWQALTGVPVAGWGLLWALLALAAGLWSVGERLQRRPAGASTAAVRLVAVAGVATSVLLGAYSLSLGQVCLTCLTTYALVGAYAVLTWRIGRLEGASGKASVGVDAPAYQRAALVLGALGLVFFLALRWPGGATPLPGTSTPSLIGQRAKPGGPAPPDGDRADASSNDEASNDTHEAPSSAAADVVAEYVQSLPPAVRRTLGEGLAAYRSAPAPSLPAVTERPFVGAADAPVRITEFSDLRCPHCARLAEAMRALAEQAPSGSFRLEARYYPLDAECNGELNPRFTDGTHVRCVAAKALLCTQDSPAYEELRHRMFRAQQNLSVSGVQSLVTEVVGGSATELMSCVASDETTAKLNEDIAYAARFGIRGTPMVVLNGRKVMAFPPLIMGLVLAAGDPHHPGFEQLAAR